MKDFLMKPYRWAATLSLLLTVCAALVLLDAFAIPKAGIPALEVAQGETGAAASGPSDESVSAKEEARGSLSAARNPDEESAEPIVTETRYADGSVSIEIETLRMFETTLYAADIRLTDAEQLRAAFAQDTFGRNIKEKTSEIAQACGALFAINGDFYGFRDNGYVLRNGVVYRDAPRGAGDDEDLAVDRMGNFSILRESDAAPADWQDAWQVFSFGPALVENGEAVVDETDEVRKSRSSNPRTAIGQIGPLHYLAIVSDGRTDENAGLTLAQLAGIFAERGCQTAYNLDGGGSSTMVFRGRVVNQPTTGGRNIQERSVSDIVYIGAS